MDIREMIEKADPCNVCDLSNPGLRRTCESLGRCDTRDAWAAVKQEVALMEAVCEADFAVSAASGDYAASVHAHFERASAMARLEDYREGRGR
jgi:hypothetical protein